MIKRLNYVWLALGMVILSGCLDGGMSTSEDQTIRFGFTAGPYQDYIEESIVPLIEEQGYSMESIQFTASPTSGEALNQAEVDVIVHQSTAFMETSSAEMGYDFAVLSHVPSAPQGLYSEKYDSIDDLQDVVMIAVPNDPVNYERALRIIEKAGWITIDDDADILSINESHITNKEYDILFEQMESAQIPRALQDLDFGIINGNFIVADGGKLSDALILEDTPEEHRVVAVYRESDEGEEWVEILVEAFESEEFKDDILSNPDYKGYILPEYMK